MWEQEDRALRRHAFLDDTARRENEGFIEELLGQFPVMRGRPAADIALAEERRDKHPGIGNDLFAPGQIEGHRDIEPARQSSGAIPARTSVKVPAPRVVRLSFRACARPQPTPRLWWRGARRQAAHGMPEANLSRVS